MKRLYHYAKWAAALLVLLFFAYQLWVLGHLLWWKMANPDETHFMALRLAALRETRPEAQLKHIWVPYAQISSHLKRAVVAAEDDGFVEHEGFDWEAIQKAMEKNRRKGTVMRGGSTISQQLAKNLFLSPSRSYLRKGEEALITFMMEMVLDKRRILEIYLNVVEWGEGVFGAEAAAQHYYRIGAARLGPEQAARLAVMLPNPRKYERQFGPRLQTQATRILTRMRNSEIP